MTLATHTANILEGRVVFGPYPSIQLLQELEENDFTMIVDLTHPSDEPYGYKTDIKRVSFSIQDRGAPENTKKFYKLVRKIFKHIRKEGRKVYIFCIGGHGRSGTLIACMLGVIEVDSGNPNACRDALNLTRKAHSKRKVMKDRMRRIGSPQTMCQKRFVANFLEYYETR